MLFYIHQGFFASGITAFNKTADTVNRLEPGTRWRGLGYIAQHLYLEKLRDDGNYQIRAYSGTIRLHNDRQRDTTFFIEKDEDFTLPLSVFVDGQPYAYQRVGSRLCLQLPVPAGMSREIAITYKNDFNLARIDIAKRSLRINAIRHLSDFRDDVVSQTRVGRWFIQSYTENGDHWKAIMIALMGLLTVFAASWYVLMRKKRPIVLQKTSAAKLRKA
jgi:hypothetical protein